MQANSSNDESIPEHIGCISNACGYMLDKTSVSPSCAYIPPMTPRPPAFVTAAASFGPAATFMPASMIGWLILRRSVTVVRICSGLGLACAYTCVPVQVSHVEMPS